ncbi:glycosyltransferase WbuB [Stutzerimonas stutzeri]|uniref:glycosyltransferase WbuB n=1 Tax=Stutzerimonas stutzeri TaxID=316 RepID=UPI002351493D|nr:glycosyltransferase WbuB [Stutzerimonas stutzeri]
MKYLLYGINYSPELTGIGKYSGEMAEWLAKHGHEVRVVTAHPYYPDWKVFPGHSHWRYAKTQEEGVTVIRCPLYVPAKPTACKRLFHLLSFSVTSTFALFSNIGWRPDKVILIVPTMFCAAQTILYAKLTRANSVLHIQDFEVDAMFGLGICSRKRAQRLAYRVEAWTLNAFDQISTISGGMIERARSKGVQEQRLSLFPNWSEVRRFQGVPRSATLLSRLGVDPRKKVLMYSGNIGEKQGLSSVIDAAELLAARNDLMFVIVGEGAGKSRLEESVKLKGLKNVVFAPLQSYEDLPALLASADCHLVIQRRGAADSVLPSKLTNILAVGGNAVITADPGTSLGVLCKEHPGIAALVEPECTEALITGIEKCLFMRAPNRVAMAYAQEYLDKDRILARFVAGPVTESVTDHVVPDMPQLLRPFIDIRPVAGDSPTKRLISPGVAATKHSVLPAWLTSVVRK